MLSEKQIPTPLRLEEEYFGWRKKVYLDYNRKIPILLGKFGETIPSIKQKVGKGFKKGVFHYSTNCNSIPKSYIEFFEDYIKAWTNHDRFLYSLVDNLDREWKVSPSFVFGKILEHDREIMKQTIFLPKIIDREREKISSCNGNKDVCFPPIIPFEYILEGKKRAENLLLANSDDFSDHSFEEMIIYLNPAKREFNIRIFLNNLSCFLENTSEKDEMNERVRYVGRMTHWAVYEEQMKRYYMEFGVVDYLMREKLRKAMEMFNPSLKKLSGAEINPKELIKLSKELEARL